MRGLGAESFGIYSVIVALLAISDWILDFGTTDVFVREIVKAPQNYTKVRKSLVALKLVQAPVAMIVMVTLLVAMRYSETVVIDGIIAGVSIAFFSGVAVYRSIFKATLTMEREMVAEFASVLTLLPLVALTVYFDLGTTGLMWSIVLSRAAFLVGCIFLADSERTLSFTGVERQSIVWLAKSSAIIGTIGLLFVINNSIEIILLSKLSRLSDVAYFAAAQKLIWPIFMVLDSIGTAYYPILAAQYPKDRARFRRSCQQALDLTVVAGGLAVSGAYCGAQFLLSLLGSDLVAATPALRILLVMCVIRSISAVIGPTLYIVGAQRHAFRYFSAILIVKVVVIYFVAPTYGFLGTAYAALAADLFLVTPVTLFYVWRFTGFRPKFGRIVAVVAISTVSILVATRLVPSSSLLSAVLACVLFAMLSVLTRVADIRTLMRALAHGERPA